ncbi:MAG: chorismate mutase [Rhodospirillales bacterium]
MNGQKSLNQLRREIDAIDTQIHDLLMARTRVVEQVRDLKRGQKIKIRPAREAEILYRLAARHEGVFPLRDLSHIWRVIIMATLSIEGPFSIAVHMPKNGSGLWDLARDQYGIFTDMTGFGSVRRVIDAVQTQKATVGILPLPSRGEADPWWPHLANTNSDRPRVIARLPFAGSGNTREPGLEALAICPVAQEPTEHDRTLIAIEASNSVSTRTLNAALKTLGLETTDHHAWRDEQRPETWLTMIELTGFFAEDDRRLNRLGEALGDSVRRVVPLGGYGLPLPMAGLMTEAKGHAK